MIEQEIDCGFGQRYNIIMNPDYSIHTIIDLKENRKVYHENRPKLFDKLQLQIISLKEFF